MNPAISIVKLTKCVHFWLIVDDGIVHTYEGTTNIVIEMRRIRRGSFKRIFLCRFTLSSFRSFQSLCTGFVFELFSGLFMSQRRRLALASCDDIDNLIRFRYFRCR